MTLSQFFCEDRNLMQLTEEEKELFLKWKMLLRYGTSDGNRDEWTFPHYFA